MPNYLYKNKGIGIALSEVASHQKLYEINCEENFYS